MLEKVGKQLEIDTITRFDKLAAEEKEVLLLIKGASPGLATREIFRAAWPIACIYLLGIACSLS